MSRGHALAVGGVRQRRADGRGVPGVLPPGRAVPHRPGPAVPMPDQAAAGALRPARRERGVEAARAVENALLLRGPRPSTVDPDDRPLPVSCRGMAGRDGQGERRAPGHVLRAPPLRRGVRRGHRPEDLRQLADRRRRRPAPHDHRHLRRHPAVEPGRQAHEAAARGDAGAGRRAPAARSCNRLRGGEQVDIDREVPALDYGARRDRPGRRGVQQGAAHRRRRGRAGGRDPDRRQRRCS